MALVSITALLAESAVADPPRRVWRDWVLVAVLGVLAVVEGLIRFDETGQPFTTVAVLALTSTLLWRRTHPLPAIVIAFGAVMVLDHATQFASGEPFEFYSAGALLILPYSLFRWASGRHAAVGIVILVAAFVSSVSTDWTGPGEALGGAFVLAFPALLGVEVRHLVGSRERTLEQARERERALLARELHDTVAHHVSAIAVRAQAGRVVAATEPAAALEALAVIEQEASRTLDEMRTIVGALRGHERAEFAPQPGLADIDGLAATPGDPPVTIHLPDDVGHVDPAVATALFRIAQEAVTNARRHARGATAVTVRLWSEDDAIRLAVCDDGAPSSWPGDGRTGFGLAGMAERATLLGGSFHAGQVSPGGWRIDATIPRNGTP